MALSVTPTDEMKTLTVGQKIYEIVDDQAREDVSEVKADFSQLPTDGVTANSKQLLSSNGTDDMEPYLLRAVPVNADRAEVNAVVGGTVVWNQLIDADTSEWANISATKNIVYNASMRLNHVYYIHNEAEIISEGDSYTFKSVGFWNTGSTNFLRKDITATPNAFSVLIKPATLPAGTSESDYTKFVFQTISTNQSTAQQKYRNQQVIDLTQMFGSTIADYIYNLERSNAGAGVAWFRKYYPADYYPYDAGTLKSVEGVSAKVTRDADNNVLGTYPLDSSVILRGIPKLVDGKLTYDGDKYLPDGTVERRYGIRAYQSGDESLANAITDGANTVYKLTTPATENATPYQSLQVCDPNGTEEFVTTGIVPVGHETFYPENLRAKIEGLPWDFSTLIAPTETGTTSRNYTTGALLIMNNVLYKVTANIANGGAITPGTNVTATTLSEVISALQ